jgi:CheY-like chemotaxis protein
MKRVLVADDYAAIRLFIREVLEDSGYLVFEASDGAEAVRSARKLLPDLIILDLDMPSLDGFGAVREIRLDERFAVTPIIAFSGSAIHDGGERALSAGFTSFMAKPVAVNALRGEMARLLEATAPGSTG